MKKRKVRWGRVASVVAVPLLIIGSIVTADVFDDKTEIIEYHKEVAPVSYTHLTLPTILLV